LENHYSLSPSSPLSKPVSLGAADTLKLAITTIEGKKAKRPHQAFLSLSEPTSGLAESFIIGVKDNGKGKLDLVCLFSPQSAYCVYEQYLQSQLDAKGNSRPTPDLWQTAISRDCHWVFWVLNRL
jgi:hypothetical protein